MLAFQTGWSMKAIEHAERMAIEMGHPNPDEFVRFALEEAEQQRVALAVVVRNHLGVV